MQNFMVDTDNELTKDILSRERHLRTRTSVLQSNGKVSAILNWYLNYVACSIIKISV